MSSQHHVATLYLEVNAFTGIWEAKFRTIDDTIHSGFGGSAGEAMANLFDPKNTRASHYFLDQHAQIVRSLYLPKPAQRGIIGDGS
jgi:hypothetical protein